MFGKNKLIRLGAVPLLWLLLSGCGLIGGNKNLVGQGVAFPPPVDSPPTSEATRPQPTNTATIEPTAEPTQTPLPTSTPRPLAPISQPTIGPPQISTFTADTPGGNDTKTITFTWESSGASAARIYNWANGSIRSPVFWDVPPTGTLTVELTGTRRRDPNFELHIYQGEGTSPVDTRFVQITWDCTLNYFFLPGPNICPQVEPTYTIAFSQEFQGGQMILLQELDWIYVLYDEIILNGRQGGDLQWERIDNHWTESISMDLSLTPPEGIYSPSDLLKFVWLENSAVQERLGWGTTPGQEYEGAWQPQPSDTDAVGDGAIFIRLENGEVVRLSGFDLWGWLWEIVSSER
jgi:hypothetical protein